MTHVFRRPHRYPPRRIVVHGVAAAAPPEFTLVIGDHTSFIGEAMVGGPAPPDVPVVSHEYLSLAAPVAPIVFPPVKRFPTRITLLGVAPPPVVGAPGLQQVATPALAQPASHRVPLPKLPLLKAQVTTPGINVAKMLMKLQRKVLLGRMAKTQPLGVSAPIVVGAPMAFMAAPPRPTVAARMFQAKAPVATKAPAVVVGSSPAPARSPSRRRMAARAVQLAPTISGFRAGMAFLGAQPTIPPTMARPRQRVTLVTGLAGKNPAFFIPGPPVIPPYRKSQVPRFLVHPFPTPPAPPGAFARPLLVLPPIRRPSIQLRQVVPAISFALGLVEDLYHGINVFENEYLGGAYYFRLPGGGDPRITEGSYRIITSGNNLIFQRRESSVWVTKSIITP